MDGTTLEAIRTALRGPVIAPQDPEYAEARKVYNAMIDRRPAAVVPCRDAADVMAAVNFLRDNGLDVAVRGGGHSGPGLAVIDDAVTIDLSPMSGVRVDPAARTAQVAGGSLLGDLDHAAHAFGLGVPAGIVSTTGVGGLTLGGGHGHLTRKYGLTVDSLTSADVVLADGSFVTASEEQHPDLFWALRGGGGNFGVATSFTYRLHPLSTVTGGLIAHPIDAAPDLLRFYRDAVADVSDDLTVFAGLVHAPDGSGHKLSALVVCHAGDPETAARELAPFMSFGSPLMTQVGPMPYPVMNTLLDAGYPMGSLNYWLSSFTRGLPDALIDAAVERFASVPSTMTAILFEHFHGAVTRIAPTATAVPHREPGWNLLIPSVWTDPSDTDANIRWTRDTHAALAPHLAARRWLNYLGDDQAEDAVRAAYGPNYERLREIKRRYDPANVFHLNHNIAP